MALAECMQSLRFNERMLALSAYAKQNPAQAAEDARGLLKGSTFEAHTAVILAKAVRAKDVAKALVSHPSELVRHTAASCGIIPPDELKQLLLSSETSRDMRKTILGCPQLPIDEETLEAARLLDQEQATCCLAELLKRCTDEERFVSFFTRIPGHALTITEAAAQGCPDGILALFPRSKQTAGKEEGKNKRPLRWQLGWLLKVASQRPRETLKLLLFTDSCGCPEAILSKLVSWGWRRQATLMADLVAHEPSTTLLKRIQILQTLASLHASSKTTFAYKLATFVQVFRVTAPATAGADLKEYIQLLPLSVKASTRHPEHCALMLRTFWELIDVAESYLAPKWPCGSPWKLFRLLETPQHYTWGALRAEEFLAKIGGVRTAGASLAPTDSDFNDAHALPGLSDDLRLRLLQTFLSYADKPEYYNNSPPICTPATAVSLFVKFLGAVGSTAALQRGFDALSASFGGQVLKQVLDRVAERMATLDAEEIASQAPLLPLPTHWARVFAEDEPKRPPLSPLAALLREMLLSTDRSEETLASLTAGFGREAFWALLRVVLAGSDAAILKLSPIPPRLPRLPVEWLTQLQMVAPAAPADAAAEGVSKLYAAKASQLMKDLQAAGKDADKRITVLRSLLALARDEAAAAKPAVFAELVPFLVKKLHTEQENVKFQLLPSLLDGVFSPTCWKTPYLAFLWHSCEHARNPSTKWKKEFSRVSRGKILAALGFDEGLERIDGACDEAVWREAAAAAEPRAARMRADGSCHWSEEDGGCDEQVQALCFSARALLETKPAAFLEVYVQAVRAHTRRGTRLPAAAAEWLLQQSLSAADSPGAHLRAMPSQMMRVLRLAAEGFDGDQRQAWRALPGLEARWRTMLAEAADLPVAELQVLLAGALNQLCDYNLVQKEEEERRQREKAPSTPPVAYEEWWAPLDVAEYEGAVGLALSRLATANVKAPVAMHVCAQRLDALARKSAKTRAGDETVRQTVEAAVEVLNAAPAKHLHGVLTVALGMVTPGGVEVPYNPSTAASQHDGVAAALPWDLFEGSSRADEAWDGSEPERKDDAGTLAPRDRRRDAITQAALLRLDGWREGRARLLAWQGVDDPSRTPRGGAMGTPQLLAALLDQYLKCTSASRRATGALRDRRALELCGRRDAAALLFFSDAFALHLRLARQEKLHALLSALAPPAALTPEERLSRAAVDRLEFYHWEADEHSLAARLVLLPPPTWTLHPETQRLLMARGLLSSTRTDVLRALPRLEFVQWHTRARELLAAFPRDQTRATAQEGKGRAPSDRFEVLPDRNDDQRVDERFSQLAADSPPLLTDQVQAREVDALVLAIGRSDDMDFKMESLSHCASQGRNKMALSALVRTVPGLSRTYARQVLRKLVARKSTSVATRIALLRLIVELRLDQPVEIFRRAWKKGACHRDVHIVMLQKLALVRGVAADDLVTARAIFDSVVLRADTDCKYIVAAVVADLHRATWEVPFLPELLARSWAFVPKMAAPVFSALLDAKGDGAPPTQILSNVAALLADARPLRQQALHGDELLAKEWASVVASAAAKKLSGRPLDACAPPALRALVEQVFDELDDGTLPHALKLWAALLPADGALVEWPLPRLRALCAHGGGGVQRDKWGAACAQWAEAAVYRALGAARAQPAAGGAALYEQAMRVVQLAREQQVVDAEGRPADGGRLLLAWAKLLGGTQSEAADVEAMLASKEAAAHSLKVVQQLCEAPARHGWRVLAWYAASAECTAPPRPGIRQLVSLGVKLVTDRSADQEKLLHLLEQHKAAPECVQVCDLLPPELLRPALVWLGQTFPAEAATRYLRLALLPADVASLLELCERAAVPMPVLPTPVVRAVLPQLLASPLHQAKAQAARLLAADGNLPELRALLKDTSPVVRAVALALLGDKAKEPAQAGAPAARGAGEEAISGSDLDDDDDFASDRMSLASNA